MDNSSNKRGANFTFKEKQTLLDVVEKYKSVIESKGTSATILHEKNEAWQKVTDEFNSEAETLRSAKQLRFLYANLKRKTRKDVAKEHKLQYLKAKVAEQEDRKEINKTGGGSYTPVLDDMGAQVLAILGDQIELLQNEFDDATHYFNDIPVEFNIDPVLVPPSQPELSQPELLGPKPARKPALPKKKLNKRPINYKQLYFKKKYETACFELKSKKHLHNLEILCIFPQWVHPWPVAAVALWLGLIQDLLIPIGLGIVDSRFCKWVSYVYKCNQRRCSDDKLPHVGLDGKFRPFGSQPQSLDITQNYPPRALQSVEHRFPITNGSLYTSIDGRLPVIHNYRRHKDQRTQVHTNAQLRHDYCHQAPPIMPAQSTQHHPEYTCRSCEMDSCPSHSNLHHLSPQYINKQLNMMQRNSNNFLLSRPGGDLQKRLSMSQESLRPHDVIVTQRTHGDVTFQEHYPPHHHHQEANNHVIKNSRNLLRLNRMRLCKSEDSLNETNREFGDNFEQNRQKSIKNEQQILDYSSSDDDDDGGFIIDTTNNPNFDSLSSRSSFSITTEANCDFDFFQSNTNNNSIVNKNNMLGIKSPAPPQPAPLPVREAKESLPQQRSKITTFKPPAIVRSNSKRSIDNFQMFGVDETPIRQRVQRSNSYMTTADRMKKRGEKKLLRSDSKMSDCTHNMRDKIKSVEYLPNLNASTVYIEDVFYFNYPNQREGKNYIGSVPDLKKVFISEYI